MPENALTLEEKLALCRYPELEPRFSKALHEVTAFILDYVPDALAILACGSILRGEGSPSSDLDMYVLRSNQQRQRLQRWFNGVPAEIFINPMSQVYTYFEQEKRSWRVITAHMVANGYAVVQLDESLDRLRETAQSILDSPPTATSIELTTARYMAACRYEDATDMSSVRPETALMIMNQAIVDMVHYTFKKAGRYLPRDKDLLEAVSMLDNDLASLIKQYFQNGIELRERMALAQEIADRTIETRGFFTWESEIEDV